MISMKTLLASAALLVAVPQVGQAEILVGFVTGLSGPVSSIGIPNAKGLEHFLTWRNRKGFPCEANRDSP